MKTFHKVATCHYIRSSQMFHTTMVKVPALFFLSKSDPVGSYDSNMRVRESYESMNMKVYTYLYLYLNTHMYVYVYCAGLLEMLG